jgi:hypothetical protein
VRLDYKTPVETIWELMEKHWNLEPPKLIVSVTGGAKRLVMKPRLMSTFKRGLINTVTAAGDDMVLKYYFVHGSLCLRRVVK